MAQKRMFDKGIIETDSFMDMPMPTKALYFLLGMEADDEGFVSPTRVMRIYGGNPDDLKVLIAKEFVIQFESGVIVITDWHGNNWLDDRRVKETVYQAEKKLLGLNKGKYSLLSNGLANAEREEYSIEQKSISAKAEVDKSDKLLSDSKVKKKPKKPAEPAAEELKFDGKEYIEKMLKDPQKHIRIIALFLTAKKIVPGNKKQMDSNLKRNFRAASNLSGYDGDKIREVMIFLRDFSLKMNIPKWTLETVGKYIDEDLEQMKKTAYQQNKSKEQRIFGENIKI